MKTPNSDFEIRPCLSNFKFYIGQTGNSDDNPLLDFSRLENGSELGMEFTISGLNRVYKNENSNSISLIILYYERLGQIGYTFNNLWSIDLTEEDMKTPFQTFKFTLTKTYSDTLDKEYDMYLNYPLVKIIAFPERIDVYKINEETLSQWMTWPQHNELLTVKIPMIPKTED